MIRVTGVSFVEAFLRDPLDSFKIEAGCQKDQALIRSLELPVSNITAAHPLSPGRKEIEARGWRLS